MDDVLCRPLRRDELPRAVDLFVAALSDLFARNNQPQSVPPRPHIEAAYRHVYETGIFYVAADGGRLAAICHAVVRDQLWFLSGFWASPALQRRGIGGALLRRVWAEGERAGARTFFVWSSSDETAMASYLRAGMLPGYQIFTLAGRPSTPGLAVPQDFVVETLPLEVACGIDEEVRGTRRAIDHRFFAGTMGLTCRGVTRGGRAVGYFYHGSGAVGPAAWLDPQAGEAVLASACREAAAQADTITLRVPGINHQALRFAFRAGLRLGGLSHLFTTAPFGRMEHYLPSGPSLF